jgi:hypothetical protein
MKVRVFNIGILKKKLCPHQEAHKIISVALIERFTSKTRLPCFSFPQCDASHGMKLA